MTQKRAFLVLAPESHGNHLVTDLLVHAGCTGGSGDHVDWKPDARTLGPDDDKPWEATEPTDVQAWDQSPPTVEDPVVWRRSVPHGGAWLDLSALLDPLAKSDYAVQVVVVTRDLHAAVQSQMKWHHVADEDEGRRNIERAYGEIFAQLARHGTPYVVTSYEALTRNRTARDALLVELGLPVPAQDFNAWDGNAKWLAAAGKAAEDNGDVPVDTGFPEAWFPPAEYLAAEYDKRLRIGKERMAQCRAVFCGLARDVERALPSALARLRIAGECFADHRVIVYENDSSDGTVATLEEHSARDERLSFESEALGKPSFASTRSMDRMADLAKCRNKVLERALEQCGDFDYLIAVDLDLPRGFSYDGLAQSFGYGGWDWMAANGIAAPLVAEPTTPPLFYDAWAFRWPGDEAPRPAAEINGLRFHRGAPPRSVWSAFGGMAVYRMEAVQSGARYSGGDCEHVAFHRALREAGFANGYVNPSLIVLYSDQNT